jgi:hypothetical protein
MAYFKWHTNHYIVFVAPPGIVSKSTTVAIAMDILRQVPGVNFGPDVVTWPALVKDFAAATEQFQIGDEIHTQCALTLESSEFGNLVNPSDPQMIDLLVALWDSKTGAFKKVTKGSGSDLIENPWINLIACTTPAWIAGNFPEYVIGGGFTSRCLFVYTDTKEKFIAYPSLHVPKDIKVQQASLVSDLTHIATQISGPYSLDPGAIEWGEAWYHLHYNSDHGPLSDDKFSGYLARKQTHLHKLAMVLAASTRDELVIYAEDLIVAQTMIVELEAHMPRVFSKIGRTVESINAEKFIDFVKSKGALPYAEAYRYIHTHFPGAKNFEDVLAGAVKAGYLTIENTPAGFIIKPK